LWGRRASLRFQQGDLFSSSAGRHVFLLGTRICLLVAQEHFSSCSARGMCSCCKRRHVFSFEKNKFAEALVCKRDCNNLSHSEASYSGNICSSSTLKFVRQDTVVTKETAQSVYTGHRKSVLYSHTSSVAYTSQQAMNHGLFSMFGTDLPTNASNYTTKQIAFIRPSRRIHT
jgi:hypothetical protein